MPSAEAAIRLPALPAAVARRCPPPVQLPAGRVLTQAEVETLWARDRAALVRCGWSLAALVDFYTGLRQQLSAADRSAAP